MAVSSSEQGLPLVFFADFYSIVCTGKVKPGKLSSSS